MVAVDESWGAASAWDPAGGEPEEEGIFDSNFIYNLIAPFTVAPWSVVANSRNGTKAVNRPSGPSLGPPPGLERPEPIRTRLRRRARLPAPGARTPPSLRAQHAVREGRETGHVLRKRWQTHEY